MSASGDNQNSVSHELVAAPKVKTANRTPILRVLRNAALILAISLVLVEFVLRMLGLADPILYESDPDIGYRLKPDQQVSYFRNEIVINSFGVRDSRPLEVRNPDKKRVLCLGDSLTWGGIYLRQEDLFTTVAERKLGDVEIINAGVNGYSTTQMVRLYEKYLTELNPDLIAICVFARNFERPSLVRLTGNSVGFPENTPTSALLEALKICRQSAYVRIRWDWLKPPDASVPVASENTVVEFANTDVIVELTKKLKDKPNVIVVFLPVGTSDVNRSFRHAYVKRMQDRGVRTPSLRSTAHMAPDDFVDGVHLSISGHAKVGAALATVIYDELAPQREVEPPPPAEARPRRDP